MAKFYLFTFGTIRFMNKQVCVGSLIVKEDKFLFGKRAATKSWYPGVWDIIGGHAMPDESPFETLLRELDEELGIVPTNYELIATVDVFEKELSLAVEYYIYIVNTWSGTPVNRGGEHSEINWFTRDEMNKIQLASEEYLSLIDAWVEGRNE